MCTKNLCVCPLTLCAQTHYQSRATYPPTPPNTHTAHLNHPTCNPGLCAMPAIQLLTHNRSSSSSSSSRIDFTCRPADLSAAVAPGDPRKTRLVSAPSASTADTLLPEDLRYQVGGCVWVWVWGVASMCGAGRVC